MDNLRHAQYILNFINTFKDYEKSDISIREAKCLHAKIPYIWGEIEQDDVFAGRYIQLAVGFSPQESNDMGYFINFDIYNKVFNACGKKTQVELSDSIKYFEKFTTAKRVRSGYPKQIAEVLKSDDKYIEEKGAAFCLYRMSGSQPNYNMLVEMGLPKLKKLIESKIKNDDLPFYYALKESLEMLEESCLYYAAQARQKNLIDMATALENVAKRAPKNMREALTLVNLYALLSGSLNYGRLDTYLSKFADDENALELLIGFYKNITARGYVFDGRVIVGGKGRDKEKACDKVAIIAIKASEKYRSVLPQLTLRFYNGQNPSLIDQAYDNFSKGCIYPMLYNDDVNIESVSKAFEIFLDEAKNYVPFGCGEFIINHASFGTPSGLINLVEILNQTLRQKDYSSFEELKADYKSNVENYVRVLAWQEKYEYECASKTASYLFLSLLYDDCISRGKAIFDGGVRYLGGTLESYGNTNAADSLTAIKQTVFDERQFSLKQLIEMLDNDFVGFESQRKMLQNCPKYGNDDDIADSMAIELHKHLCEFTKSQAVIVGLDNYLIVIINNNANSLLGANTGASADGRRNGEPMANANNPSGGSDKNGITSFLNSLVKLDSSIHAGSVQNMKFTPEIINSFKEQFKSLMSVYFLKGSQAMLNIISKGDLEKAILNPEKYYHLIVRVGGFSARFVELDKKTQLDILSRTLNG